MTTKHEFLVSELWILSWGASVQRANLFVPETAEAARRQFRGSIIAFATTELLGNYESGIAESQHERNIQLLCAYGTDVGTGLLGPNGYKVGVAQKLLNLQLKYLWCLGVIPEPPHCPIDRVVINKTPLRNTVAWTQMAGIEVYRGVIRAVKVLADQAGLSIANWELQTYDRANA